MEEKILTTKKNGMAVLLLVIALYIAAAHAERGRDAGLCRADERCDRSAGIRYRSIARHRNTVRIQNRPCRLFLFPKFSGGWR